MPDHVDFDALAGDLVADELAADPTTGSGLGLTRYDDLLPDLSADAIRDREVAEDRWAARFAALDPSTLGPEERVDRDLVRMVLRGRALRRPWAQWRRSADTYAGPALAGVHGLLLHRLRPDAELARSLTARLRGVPALLAQGRANLDPDLAAPALLRRSLGQLRAGAAYLRDVAGQIDPAADGGAARSAVAAAAEPAAAAFEEFAGWVADLAERAGGHWAVGEQVYDGLLREAEGLGYGARGLRERGQAAYDELLADLRARTAALRGGDGSDWRAELAAQAADAPGSPEAMLAAYTEATAAARAFCADRALVTLPADEQCVVEPSAPFTRSMLAVAHYVQPPPYAGGPPRGHFFVPYPPDGADAEQVRQRLATNNHHGLWSVTVHEAYPGHHWHFVWLAAAAAAGSPYAGARPLRTVYSSTYFVEGWGLYAEELMREQGFFRTARQELAQREMRLFRAARMVVDTSLHLGEMDVEEAVRFLVAGTALTEETARAEVLRYCAWPTQAASYLTGALEIARLRARWASEGRGSLRTFHDAAAGSGRLPIALVERTLFGPPPADRPAGRG